MLLSVYSVCMALLYSWMLIGVLRLIFRNPQLAYRLHPDFLTITIWLFILRMLLPCTFLVGIELPWYTFFHALEKAMDSFYFLGINGFGWLSWIWLAGFVVSYIRYRIDYDKQEALLSLIMEGAEKYRITDFIPDYLGPDYEVWICPNVRTSFSMGRSQRIILPADPMTQEEYEFVLLHEVHHLTNDDVSYIRICRYMRFIYWWFPPIYSVKPTMDLFFEIRVDLMVNQNRTPQARLDYSKALLKFSSPSSKYIGLKSETQAFSTMPKEPIKSRIHFLLNSDFDKPMKTHPILMALPFLTAFLSALILLSTHSLL